MRSQDLTRVQELQLDLDVTELIFDKLKSNKAKEAINNLRYLIILELHKQQYISGLL